MEKMKTKRRIQTVDTLWYLIPSCLSLVGTIAVVRSPSLTSTVIFIIAVAILTLWAAARWNIAMTFVYAFGLLLVMSASMQILTTGAEGESSLSAIAVRIVGVLLFAAVSLMAGRRLVVDSGYEGDQYSRSLMLRAWLISFALPVTGFIIVATFVHGLWAAFFSYGLGAGLLCLSMAATSRVPSAIVTNGIVVALALAVVGSLAAGLVIPGSAIEQLRLRGLFENANSLGFFAFLLGGAALLLVRTLRTQFLLFTAAVTVLVWTASRASALALAVLVIVYLLRRKPLRAFVVALVLSAFAFVFLQSDALDFSSFDALLRNNNSREGSWNIAVQTLSTNPVVGLGFGREPTIVASSPLRAAVVGGVVGLAIIMALYIAMLRISYRYGARTLAFTVAGLVHALFEGWLLSPVSPLIIVFSICWWAMAQRDWETAHIQDEVMPSRAHGPRHVRL